MGFLTAPSRAGRDKEEGDESGDEGPRDAAHELCANLLVGWRCEAAGPGD